MDDVIGEDFVSLADHKRSLFSPQIHASLSLPKIKGNIKWNRNAFTSPRIAISLPLLSCKVISCK